jgi:hypothetical protein
MGTYEHQTSYFGIVVRPLLLPILSLLGKSQRGPILGCRGILVLSDVSVCGVGGHTNGTAAMNIIDIDGIGCDSIDMER